MLNKIGRGVREMDIVALSAQMAMDQTGTAVGMAVANLLMDQTQQNGAQMVDMMKGLELSVNPHLGANIDIRI